MRKKLSTEKRECSVKRRKLFTGAKAKPDKNYGPKADNPPPNIAKEDLEKLCDEKINEYQNDRRRNKKHPNRIYREA